MIPYSTNFDSWIQTNLRWYMSGWMTLLCWKDNQKYDRLTITDLLIWFILTFWQSVVAEQIKALKFSKTDFAGGRLKCTSLRIFICQWEKRKNFILTFTAILLLSIPNFWLAVIMHRVATLDSSFFPGFTASTISGSHKQFKRVKPTCTSCITFGNLVCRKLYGS